MAAERERESPVTIRAFDRAMFDAQAEEALFTINRLAGRAVRKAVREAARDDYEPGADEPRERRMTAARLAELEAEADAYFAARAAMTPEQRAEADAASRAAQEERVDAAMAAALVPPDFEGIALTDAQCMDVAALLAPYAALDER